MKLKEMRAAKNLSQPQLAEAIGTDFPMISKFENFKCLPTPGMMKSICQTLECTTEDLYEPKEITFERKAKKKKRRNSYKLTVELETEAKQVIKEATKALGFGNATNWVTYCYDRLKKRLGRKKGGAD